MRKSIEVAIHLFHIVTLIGCGHLLQEGKMFSAVECAVTGSLCVVILASADIFANWIKGE